MITLVIVFAFISIKPILGIGNRKVQNLHSSWVAHSFAHSSHVNGIPSALGGNKVTVFPYDHPESPTFFEHVPSGYSSGMYVCAEKTLHPLSGKYPNNL